MDTVYLARRPKKGLHSFSVSNHFAFLTAAAGPEKRGCSGKIVVVHLSDEDHKWVRRRAAIKDNVLPLAATEKS